MKPINPEGWPRPAGFSNGVLAEGKFLCIAGQIGWDENGVFVSDEFIDQAAQAMRNILAVLRAAGGGPEHLVRMTWYVTDKGDYVAASQELGVAYQEIFGTNYPAMTLVQVAGLLDFRAKFEIEATAVLP
jgi:enamine deaminase RidA (YjgF/YER057c/UK114 family)